MASGHHSHNSYTSSPPSDLHSPFSSQQNYKQYYNNGFKDTYTHCDTYDSDNSVLDGWRNRKHYRDQSGNLAMVLTGMLFLGAIYHSMVSHAMLLKPHTDTNSENYGYDGHNKPSHESLPPPPPHGNL